MRSFRRSISNARHRGRNRATLARWKLNPRRWLAWYLESRAAAGGKAPEDIQPFLPWNLSDEHRLALGTPATVPTAHNTS